MTRLSILAGAVAAAATLANQAADGHILQTFPVSRQYSYGPVFRDWQFAEIDYCPHCYNARGPAAVRERAEKETDPDALAKYGGGEYPLVYSGLAENGNYKEPQAISVRHGVCGDPEQNADEGSNTYSTPNSNWDVLEDFEGGSVIEMNIIMNAYHWGHCEFFVCNADEMGDPDGTATQECFNKYPLNRADDDGAASPIDPKHPGRYYVDPVCRGEETRDDKEGDAPAGYTIKMRYVLPDIQCEHCVLQMVYYTGNSCKHIGYDEFEPDSWPGEGDCGSKDKWINMNLSNCGENGAYPEEFWACSDISISGDGNAPPEPPGEEPEDKGTAPPTTTPADPKPTSAPTASEPGDKDKEPTYAPSDSPTGGGDDPTTAPSSTTPGDNEPTYAPSDAPTGGGDEGTDAPTSGEPDGGGSGSYEHVGCYADSRDDRILGGRMSSESMTADECLTHCNRRNAAYMATQHGDECWCSKAGGLDFERHGFARCDMMCSGDTTETCGGYDAFDLYKLEWPEPSTSPEYVDCYADSQSDRVMRHQMKSDSMTQEACREHCDGRGPYYGIQYSTECWCGVSEELSDYERHGEGVCHMRCSGDPDIQCGGLHAFSLFKYGDGSTDPPTDGTMAPTNATAAPTDATAAPTDATAAPTDATAAPTDATAAPTDASAAPTMAPTTKPTDTECEGEPVEPWEQCGGDKWTGSTCCPEGYECQVMGKGTCYSQCRLVSLPTGGDPDY